MDRRILLASLFFTLILAANTITASPEEGSAGSSLLWNIALVLLAATVLAYISGVLKQPLILGYVLAGIIIGPLGLGLITEEADIKTMSELGIAFLLFIVGLEIDLRRIRDIGFSAAVASLTKSILVGGMGFLIAMGLGFPRVESLYIGLVVAFSSTMVVIKLLSDKNKLDTLHGRIILGMLLMEDVLAILVLSLLSTPGEISTASITLSIIKGLGLFSIAIVVSRFVLPTVFKHIADSHELLFLTAISILFVFAKVSEIAGFPIAIGAFIAGIAVAIFPYNIEIVGRVRSLRDFFATIFFVSLGMEIWVGDFRSIILPALLLLPLVLVVKPFIIMSLSSISGYGRRPSFLTAIGLTQISEFSLIIALQGLALGHIGPAVFSLTAVIAVVTITLTSYLIQFDNQIYKQMAPYLGGFERLSVKERLILEDLPRKSKEHVIVCGAHRLGYDIIKTLMELKKGFLAVDFNPEIIKSLIEERIPCIYGDVGDMEVLDRIDLDDASMVISTVSNQEDNLLIVEESKRRNPKASVIVDANTIDQALELYNAGADYVILPRMLSGEMMSEFLIDYEKHHERMEEMKEAHIVELEDIKENEVLQKYEPWILKSLEKKFENMSQRGPKSGKK